MSCVLCVIWRWPVRARAQSGVAWCRSPPYAPQTASLEGESHAFEAQGASRSIGGALHAFEAQGASRSIGGPAPVVMPHLGEDFIGSVLQKADATSFETELNVGACELCVPGCVSVLSTGIHCPYCAEMEHLRTHSSGHAVRR